MKSSAFTLIELLVVIAIIGILSSFVFVSMNSAQDIAYDARKKADVNQLSKAVGIYMNSNPDDLLMIDKNGCSIGGSCASNELFGEAASLRGPKGDYYVYISDNGMRFIISTVLSSGEEYYYDSASGRYMTAVPFICGEDVVFQYRGEMVTYGTVLSQAGKCWMDRNLGASRVGVSYDDVDAYGDLFQWGRADDGHQDRNSGTTNTLADSPLPGHDDFIYSNTFRWMNVQRIDLWQGVSGINNPCPFGWRVPTKNEWESEMAIGGWTNKSTVFNSPLKIVSGGRRLASAGALNQLGYAGCYWSSTPQSESFFWYFWSNGGSSMYTNSSGGGNAIRCIKD